MCSQMRLVAHAIVAFDCSPIHVRYVPSFDVALELNHPATSSLFPLMKYVLSSSLFQSKSIPIFLNAAIRCEELYEDRTLPKMKSGANFNTISSIVYIEPIKTFPKWGFSK